MANIREFLPKYTNKCNEFEATYCNCNYILFIKLPWPWNSEETFRSSTQAATNLPVYHTRWRLHTVPLIAERQAGKLWIPIFIVFDLTRPGIKPESTVSIADALSTRPLIGSIPLHLGMDFNQCRRYEGARGAVPLLTTACAPHFGLLGICFWNIA